MPFSQNIQLYRPKGPLGQQNWLLEKKFIIDNNWKLAKIEH